MVDVDIKTNPPAFVPLEGNPDVMNKLLYRLGLKEDLAIHDVYSISEPGLIGMVPRPAPAVLLVFPTSAAYEAHRLAADVTVDEYKGRGENEPVVWFKQTISNACGLMALLHAVCNGDGRKHIQQGTELEKLLTEAIPLPPRERAGLLEQTRALQTAHAEAAEQGDTKAPEASDNVDLHYVAFVKAGDGNLWELDGRRKGPINLGPLDSGEDALSEKALSLGPKKFLEREPEDPRFSCLALARAGGDD